MSRCALSGIDAPRVTTLVVDPRRPTTQSLVVTPRCEETMFAIANATAGELFIQDKGIQAVVGVPSDVQSLDLSRNLITSFVTSAQLRPLAMIDLSFNQITSLSSLSLPPCTRLKLDGNPLETMQASELPQDLEELSIANTRFSSLTGLRFPSSLTNLTLGPSIGYQTLRGLVLPPRLKVLNIAQSEVTQVSGVAFPSTLTAFGVGGAQPLTVFDLRQSDLEIMASIELNLVSGTNITNCSDARGQLTPIQRDWFACVYPDDVFYELFPAIIPISSQPPPTPKWEFTFSPPASADASAKSDGVPVVLLAVVAVVLVAAATALFLFIRQSKRRKKTPPTEGRELVDANWKRSQPPVNLTLAAVTNDVRTDVDMIQYKLPMRDVMVQSLLGESQWGQVYLATVYGRAVTVKRFTPCGDDGTAITAALQSFVDEIRLHSTLDHAKIVQFVGLTWTGVVDLSLVAEYLPRGSLSRVLREMHTATTPRSSQPWSERVEKAAIAMNVVEALVYLHSFNPPILHGNVSAKAVFLSESYEAKLSMCGCTRVADVEDDAMTYRGSASGVAPEVAKGGRFTAKADVFALGGLLFELDSWWMDRAAASPTGESIMAKLAAACGQIEPSQRPSAVEVHFRIRTALVDRTSPSPRDEDTLSNARP